MPNLVGTSLNQVPTNSMLGGLAYQDPDHASIKDLDLKNLSQINSEIADTAVDVFVYDTRKDSDGGAWRKRTQNTSWYNETLGTATRGTRKEFPAVAVIVATVDDVIIYDGDDPDLPMWMVFKSGDSGSAWETYYLGRSSVYNGSSGPQIRAIAMLNGRLAVGKNWSGTGNYAEAYTEIGFIGDRALRKDSSASEKMNNSIVSRNGSAGGYSKTAEGVLKNPDINDVAMTVLPNAPVDSATGLPVPTIVVATGIAGNGGTSVIKDDRTVVDITGFNPVTTVHIDVNNVIGTSNSGTPSNDFIFKTRIPSGDEPFTDGITAGSKNYYMNSSSGTIPLLRDIDMSDSSYNSKDNVVYRGGTGGFDIIRPGINYSSTHSNPAIAYISSSFNTGYMLGDIKGAYLSDTSTMNAGPDSEIVSNGDFGTGTTGWDASAGSITETGGQLVASGESSWQTIGFTKNYNFIPGNVYHITWTMGGGSSSGIIDYSNNGTLSPTTGANYYYPGPGTYTITYTPASAAPSLRFVYFNTAANPGTLDNVSIIPAVQDRSVNNNGVQVYGSITKTAVATGADLVAYSGFNASNYLRHTIATNYGSAATITMGGWCKIAATHVDADYNYLCSVRNTSAAITAGVAIRKDQGDADSGKPYFFENTNNALQSTGPRVDDDQWHHIIGVLDGTSKKIYIDGKLINQSTVTAVNLSAVDVTNVGHYVATSGTASEYYNRGSLALIKFSASAASTEQIKKMYEDEKHLFQENAKATLYGSSDAVTALAYDDTTTTLHVGTSAGRSEFQGLRRINNTTTAVTTAISASNGLVTEQ